MYTTFGYPLDVVVQDGWFRNRARRRAHRLERTRNLLRGLAVAARAAAPAAHS